MSGYLVVSLGEEIEVMLDQPADAEAIRSSCRSSLQTV